MDDRAGDAAAIRPISVEELGPLWDAFRRGKHVLCLRDGGPLALAVDATAHAYRMICVKCGSASPWFEVAFEVSSEAPSQAPSESGSASEPGAPGTYGRIQVRSGTSSMPAPARPGLHDD